MAIIPGLAWKVGLAVLLATLTVVVLWQIEPFRVRRSLAAAGCLVCFVALAGLSFAVPTDREDEFLRHQYVSKFARSGAVAAVDLLTRGVLEADADDPRPVEPPRRRAGMRRRPQAAPHRHGVRRIELRRHHAAERQGAARLPRPFPLVRRQDAVVRGRGRRRSRAGTPSTTCSPGCPCAPTGVSPNPSPGSPPAGSSADCPMHCESAATRPTASIPGSGPLSAPAASRPAPASSISSTPDNCAPAPPTPTASTYDHAARVIAQDRGNGPVFVFVYLAANHFPWSYRYRPDLLPDWVNPGNPYRDRRISCAARR